MREESKEWLRKAQEDYETAAYLLKGNKHHGAAFFSQQAAEKALKAIQIEKLGRFDRSHDLVLLASSVGAPKKIIEVCAKLSPHYVSTRYPDVQEIHSQELTKNLLVCSKEVVEWALPILNSKKS